VRACVRLCVSWGLVAVQNPWLFALSKISESQIHIPIK
jgi:hypothetical protein